MKWRSLKLELKNKGGKNLEFKDEIIIFLAFTFFAFSFLTISLLYHHFLHWLLQVYGEDYWQL